MTRPAPPGDRKVALVTGGARRIGAAIARALAGAGYRVVLTYRSSRAEARALGTALAADFRRLDLSSPGAIDRLAASLARDYGRLDLLVHNAAVFPRTPVDDVTPRVWDEVFAVNVRGPFLLTRRLLSLLRRSPGAAVVFIGDAGAARLWPGYLPYCLSKLALAEQARAWRKVAGPAIRVGLVRPGLALRPPGFPEEAWERLRARRGSGSLDSPARVAAAVLRFARGRRYNRP